MTNPQLRQLLSQFPGLYIRTWNHLYMYVRQAHKLYRRDRVALSGPAFRFNTTKGTAFFFKEVFTYTNLYSPSFTTISRKEFLQALAQALEIKDDLTQSLKDPTPHDNPTPITPVELKQFYSEHPWLLQPSTRQALKKREKI